MPPSSEIPVFCPFVRQIIDDDSSVLLPVGRSTTPTEHTTTRPLDSPYENSDFNIPNSFPAVLYYTHFRVEIINVYVCFKYETRKKFALVLPRMKGTYMRWANSNTYDAIFMKGKSRNDSSLSFDERSIWLCNSHTYWRQHNAGATDWS